MGPTSFWELVKNNPEWVGVVTSVIFAVVTAVILGWQVFVMQRQERNSSRHEETQNNLLQLQLEHEFVRLLNAERERILELAKELKLSSDCFMNAPISVNNHWNKLKNTAYELNERLSVLDLRAYSGSYGKWYFDLNDYVDALLKAVVQDTDTMAEGDVRLRVMDLLRTSANTHKLIDIQLAIESAIRMEVFGFEQKWNAALK